MKIDRKRPSHWLYLVLTGIHGLLALALRALLPARNGRPPWIVLYGHKLNGNLLALYRYMDSCPGAWRPVFLTMDPAYYRRLRAEGIDCVLAPHPAAAWLLARAAAVITDHGLHSLRLLLGRGKLPFFDVWHGVPFKGFDAGDFRVQQRYDEVWVSSPALRDLYVERFGFDAARVVATGYARTDTLLNAGEAVRRRIRQTLGLQAFERCVLFAPTWSQDDARRDIYPFGIDEATFLDALAAVCERHRAALLVRKHLNTAGAQDYSNDRVRFVSSADHPDTESILAISDVLIVDWSSVAFDFLLLDRPAIFLDVPPPFAKGFSLGPEFRFGDVATDMPAVLELLDSRLRAPSVYLGEHGAAHRHARDVVYGGMADGHAAERCVARLRHHLVERHSLR
ncbi:MAG TPA: CDP-glycerol glycerophosphotransferase family protein [Frateuria sp.]|uniref:CDP-glycerol glycerophosphotransferase family protein n=1 Tax=Frateuria sp. TaxID=2211372 RepID=UPI002D7E2376|nr:CDP-glycerol glycerophosphotransferase family protein [Frateuria sp.]HET6804147.1 CDP-glycerol glycerophosphotransferase family protein [Frateuria sp.]